MAGDIKHVFMARKIKRDKRWEVVTPEEEQIASFENENDAVNFEIALNLACTDASEKRGAIINE